MAIIDAKGPFHEFPVCGGCGDAIPQAEDTVVYCGGCEQYVCDNCYDEHDCF